MNLSVAYDFLPKTRSVNASIVMDHFGVDFEQGRHVIADDVRLPIRRGDIVFFTGPSGSGKSSLLRAAADRIHESGGVSCSHDASAAGEHVGSSCVPRLAPVKACHPVGTLGSAVLAIDGLNLGDAILVDGLDLPADEALGLLSQCGLSEAQLMLRRPAELSDGQRYRFRLARAIRLRPDWVLADEFTASLDRTLAKVIAYNVRRLADRRGIGFLLATTHDDVLEDLNPDVLVHCDLDGRVRVERRSVKKNQSAWRRSYGSARAPQAIGRTSLGGITEVTTSASAGA